MSNKSIVNLPYIKGDFVSYTTPSGFRTIDGVYQAYKNKSIRNVVVCRVDLLRGLLVEFFTDEVFFEYREALYKILSKSVLDENLVSSALTELYKRDDKFKTKLGKLFYFRSVENEHLSLYETIVEEASKTIDNYVGYLSGNLPIVKSIGISEGYYYFSIQDVYTDVEIVKNLLSLGLEVVSSAKAWGI